VQTSGEIDNLITRVLEKAKDEAASMVSVAQRAAEREIQQAKQASDARLARVKAVAEEAIGARRRSVVSELRLQERKAVMDSQEAAVRRVLSEALAALRAATPDRERREVLVRLVREGVSELGGPAVYVRMNPSDRADAAKNGFPGEVDGVEVRLEDETLDCAGGVTVTDETGRITVDNTFEARLDRRRGALRELVAEGLGFRGTGQ